MKSNIGLMITEDISCGGLVSDDITNALADGYLKTLTSSVILDGYPRTLVQAEFLTNQNKCLKIPTIAINIVMDQSVIDEKLRGRRKCRNCEGDFNVADVRRNGFDMPPILPYYGNCIRGKNCEADLICRDDDTDEIIYHRFSEYEKNVEPLLAHFRKLDCLRVFEVKKGLADTNDLINTMLSG